MSHRIANKAAAGVNGILSASKTGSGRVVNVHVSGFGNSTEASGTLTWNALASDGFDFSKSLFDSTASTSSSSSSGGGSTTGIIGRVVGTPGQPISSESNGVVASSDVGAGTLGTTATPFSPSGLSLFSQDLESGASASSSSTGTASAPTSTSVTPQVTIVPSNPSVTSSFFSTPLTTTTTTTTATPSTGIWQTANAGLSTTTGSSNGVEMVSAGMTVAAFTTGTSQSGLVHATGPRKLGQQDFGESLDMDEITAFSKDFGAIKKVFERQTTGSGSSSSSSTSLSSSSSSSFSILKSSTMSNNQLAVMDGPQNGMLRGNAKPFYPGAVRESSTSAVKSGGSTSNLRIRETNVGQIGRQSSVQPFTRMTEPSVQVLSTSAVGFPPPQTKPKTEEIPIAVVATDLVGAEMNQHLALQPLKRRGKGKSNNRGKHGKNHGHNNNHNNHKGGKGGKKQRNKGNSEISAQTNKLVNKYDQLKSKKSLESTLAKDTDLVNGIAQALCRVGRSQEALALVEQFDTKIQDHTYVAVLLGLAEQKRGKDALALLSQVLNDGRVRMKPQLYTALIHRCGDANEFGVAVQVFEMIQSQVDVQANEITYCSMVQAAMRSNELDYAMGLVSEMPLHNFHLSEPLRLQLVGALVDNKRMSEAFEVYQQNRETRGSLKGHHYLLNSLLDYSSKQNDKQQTMDLLADMKANKMYPANRTFTNVMHMFMRNQDVDTALGMLDELTNTGFHMTTLYFNTLLDSFSKINNERFRRNGALMAKSVFEHMHVLGVEPDIITFGTLIKVYNRSSLLKEAEHAFWMLKERRDLQPNIVIVNSMLDVYVRHGSLEDAQRVFDEMESEYLIRPQTITFNTLISGYGKVGKIQQALDLIDRMEAEHLIPDVVTHNIMIAAYAKAQDLDNAKRWFENMEENGHLPDLVSYSTMVNLCGKKGNLDEAFRLFQDMRNRGMSINNIAYGSLIEGCGMQGRINDAIDLLAEMIDQRIQPSHVTFSFIISACGKLKKLDDALHVWKMMTEAGVPGNTVTYNTLIDACRRSNAVETALVLFQEMLETADDSTKPDVITFNTLINACQSTRDTEKALELFGTMKSMKIPVTDITYNCLIDVASLNGDLECARSLLNEMHENGFEPTVITFTLMVRGCARAGNFDEAYRMLEEMQSRGIQANDITFSSLLDACTRRRDLGNAQKTVEIMERFGVDKTAITMVPLLHTLIVCNALPEAHELILELNRLGFQLEKTAWSKMMATLEEMEDESAAQVRADLERLEVTQNQNQH